MIDRYHYCYVQRVGRNLPRRAPEIQHAVSKAQLLARRLAVAHLAVADEERQRPRDGVQDGHVVHDQLYVSCSRNVSLLLLFF